MESSHEAAPEKRLCEILDAIEAGLLHLGRERDELRRTLLQSGNPVPAKKPVKKSVKKAAKRKTKKAGPKTPRPLVNEPAPELAVEPKPEKPKAPPKKRSALGRTLTQIRAPRG